MAVLVSRSRVALLGPVAASLVLGGLAGAALAFGGGSLFGLGECGDDGSELQRTEGTGAASAGLSVELRLTCGTLDVVTSTEGTWRVEAAHRGEAPTIEAGASTLRVSSPDGLPRRHEWRISLPSDVLDELDVDVNASRTILDLTGSGPERVDVQANAGDVAVVASEASIGSLDVHVNAGKVRLLLDADVEGTVAANAGSIELCASESADLTLEVKEQLTFDTDLDETGLVRTGDTWHRAGSGGPTITLRVEGNASSFRLDPESGCR